MILFVAPQVSTASLLNDMYDLTRLTRRPSTPYRTVEWSSYDRRSKVPGNDDWFANDDWGKYIRSEQKEGRTEWVMAEHEGPGALLRFWSANPMGTVRIYLDGETKPRLQTRLADLLSGKVANLGEPYGYIAARGNNLYYPFPHAKRMKVTVAADQPGDNLDRMYYTVHGRLYNPGTSIETYTEPVTSYLTTPDSRGPKSRQSQTIKVNGLSAATYRLKASTPSVIREFVVQNLNTFAAKEITDPSSAESMLKNVELRIWFDNAESIRVPLPDFFGAGVLPAQLKTMVASVDGAKTMTQRLPMPFKKTAAITFYNRNRKPLSFRVSTLVENKVPTDYVLHATWTSDIEPSRPFRDIEMVDYKGEGRYVGSVLHVQNPSIQWWGEGDEKIWVDNESFPSHFGTGTEDYFGYAWSNPETFNRPYHAQPRADGPGTGGQISNVRWHILDDIPFRSRIKFDLEMWHWQETPSRFDATAFWYAPSNPSWNPKRIVKSGLKIIAGPPQPPAVPGVIEGELLPILLKSGGHTERQFFTQLSRGEQLFWRDGKDGDRLQLEFTVAKAGRYTLEGHHCFAPDYGISELSVNGAPLGTQDFYSAGLHWKTLNWGEVNLPKGKSVLTFTIRGSNAAANPARRMLGLDYLKLTPVNRT